MLKCHHGVATMVVLASYNLYISRCPSYALKHLSCPLMFATSDWTAYCMRQESCDLQVVGFVPTGWMYEMKRKAFPVREKGSCFIHLVPYSEHSSYSELREYVRFLKPHKVHKTYAKSL